MSDPPSSQSDHDLVVLAQSGDAGAVAALYTRYWRAARAAAYGVLGNVLAAEDAAAEAFQAALATLGSLRDPDLFAPWLRRITLRTARRQRERGDLAATPFDDTPADLAGPAELLEQREIALIVSQAVERLPVAEREAIVLFYVEGYDGNAAARFLGIPVGSLRRRLHDGRARMRAIVAALLDPGAIVSTGTADLRARVDALLAGEPTAEQMYTLLRNLFDRRPVPKQLLMKLMTGSLARAEPVDEAAIGLARRIFRPPPSPDDPRPIGVAVRALRGALTGFEEWHIDLAALPLRLPQLLRLDEDGRAANTAGELAPPGFLSGSPSRYFRATRGLLFPSEGGAVIDSAELLRRSDSLARFGEGMRQAWISDVLDVYWMDDHPIELSSVEAWVGGVAESVAPNSGGTCRAQWGPRYRSALRMTFPGDPRPAAIGGVLSSWPGAMGGVQVVHVRLFVEPWAQACCGQPVPMDTVANLLAR